ncbi:MAG: archease [Candidatus Tectomicrobia bacterium]|nr:archease [Candidatus Tectomicrobia bacterium]
MPAEPDRAAIYTLVEHTADLGIVVYGEDMGTLFAHAAWALFDVISDATTIEPRRRLPITLDAMDRADLLVRWLGELLYVYDTQRFLCCDATFSVLEPTRLEAIIHGEPLDESRHPIDTEIKAVTYHQIAVEQVGTHWQAQVIFDV